jgi:hypothetical protein
LTAAGDCIARVAHVKGIGQRDAELLLQDAFMRQEPEKAKPKKRSKKPVGGTEPEREWTIVDFLEHST